MGDLKVFAYGEQQVRTVLVDDAPWWVLADVCKALGLTTPSRVAERLDEDEKMTLIWLRVILDSAAAHSV